MRKTSRAIAHANRCLAWLLMMVVVPEYLDTDERRAVTVPLWGTANPTAQALVNKGSTEYSAGKSAGSRVDYRPDMTNNRGVR